MNETNIDAPGCFCRELPDGQNCTACERQAYLDDAACLRQEAIAACVRHNSITRKIGDPTMISVLTEDRVS